MKQEQVDKIREFNRFYATFIGLLDKSYLNSDYSLAEVRVMFEIYRYKEITANDILTTLRLDKGYLSRILKTFEKKKMLVKMRSLSDGRALNLALTNLGKEEFLKIDNAVIQHIKEIYAILSDEEYEKLIKSMQTIKNILKNTQNF
jgi:DNA-binding MarR family transcriptional regulator